MPVPDKKCFNSSEVSFRLVDESQPPKEPVRAKSKVHVAVVSSIHAYQFINVCFPNRRTMKNITFGGAVAITVTIISLITVIGTTERTTRTDTDVIRSIAKMRS